MASSSRALAVSSDSVVGESPERRAFRNTDTTWSAVALIGTATGGVAARFVAGPVEARWDCSVVPAESTAVFFEQRTWHCRGQNFSDQPRVGLFFGYGYRWLRPMDFVQMPEELLARCSPVRRQLLGDAATQLGFYLPKDEDVPLRAWAEARAAATP